MKELPIRSLWREINENINISLLSKKSSRQSKIDGEYNFKSLYNDGYDITQPSGFLNPSNMQIYVMAHAKCPPAESPVTINYFGFIPS